MNEAEDNPMCGDKEDEPDLIANNKGKIGHFRRFGFFLVHWKNGKYESSQRKLLLYYLIWYLAAFSCGALAYAIKEIFKKANYEDRVDDLIEAAFAVIVLGLLPSAGIYLLREYSTNLPQILMRTKKLENTEIYKKLKFAQNSSKLSYMEGFTDEDHNDIDDEINVETEKSEKKQWWLVKYGPLIGVILSFATCFILIIVSFFWDLSDLILTTSVNSFDHLKRDLPAFLMTVIFPIPAFGSIWFCIFFLEWHRNIQGSVRHFIRDITSLSSTKNSTGDTMLSAEHKKDLEKLCCMLNRVQKVFILLNKKIFQKTIVKAFVLFIFLDVFCSWKILQNTSNFFYIIPLFLTMGHIYLICKWSNDLMEEFDETMEVLNEIHEGDVENLRRELQECPPQALAFGGFSVNYSMMTAVVAFILSIISISGMIWPEVHNPEGADQKCYEYQDNVKGWNYTVCIKQYCYHYEDDVTGLWNNTLCIKDEINNKLFINDTFCLRV